MLDTANTEFSSIKMQFTDQNNEPLEIKDNVNNYWADIIKTRYSTESKYRKYVKGNDFLSFARKCGEKYDKMLMDSATKQEQMLQKLLPKDQFKTLQKLQEI